MAGADDKFVAEDKPLEPQDQGNVKSLPEDADETNFDEVVDKDPELKKDMTEGIDKSNIIDETTRGAKPQKGAYKEPSDDISDLVDE
ncbi:hypothetical protein E4U43_005311 [Claviceps pusilla]|uniref:Histone chaperone domain-containing protein n=1 Tax=Claviceps pusilla TaxID=123648 RepID=A0A9P7SWF3_9HYPO|nr:hypothetical protein E4U43_005311 [Claviceps pusilla]